jgi:hypothetical protein
MLTLPVKIRRKKQPYLAIRSRLLRRQVARQAQLFLPEIRSFMEDQGIPQGPAFFRYNTTSLDGELDIEFGHFTDKHYPGNGPIRAGFLPGGPFMSLTWFGNYSRFIDVHSMFMGWAQLSGIEWDQTPTEAGMFFGCRVDIFHKAPRHDPNPDNWQTELLVLLKAENTAEN